MAVVERAVLVWVLVWVLDRGDADALSVPSQPPHPLPFFLHRLV